MIARNQGLFPKKPTPVTHGAWCVEETKPDPGVVDCYSRVWSGTSPADVDSDAHWRIQVTRRTTNGAPDRATIDVEINGSYPTAGPITAALGEAQSLANRLNVGVPARDRAVW